MKVNPLSAFIILCLFAFTFPVLSNEVSEAEQNPVEQHESDRPIPDNKALTQDEIQENMVDCFYEQNRGYAPCSHTPLTATLGGQ